MHIIPLVSLRNEIAWCSVTEVKLAEPAHMLPSYSALEELCGSMSLQPVLPLEAENFTWYTPAKAVHRTP